MTRLPAVLAAAALVAACGGGEEGPGFAGEWDVVLVVGAAVADPAADTSAFPGEGSDASEPWELDCDDPGGPCVLHRPPGGLLGALDELRLAPTEEDGTLAGEATGVTPPPALEEPSPCAGSAAETWTVQVEVSLRDDVLVGSVFRIPDALVDGDCFGLDLTLGLSGSRAR